MFIKAGALPRVSAEIFQDLTLQDGRTFRRALRAVALLGSQMPALWESLDNLRALYAAKEGTLVTYTLKEVRIMTEKQAPPEAATVAIVDVKKFEAEIAKRDAELAEKAKALESKDAILAKYEAELATIKAEKRATEIHASVETLKREGYLIPKAEEAVRALLFSLNDEAVIKYSEGGKEDEVSPRDLFEQFLKLNGKVIEYQEKAPGSTKAQADASNVYGLRWPVNAHHILILADDKYVMSQGDPQARVKMRFHAAGERHVVSIAYALNNKEIGRDTLDLVVTA